MPPGLPYLRRAHSLSNRYCIVKTFGFLLNTCTVVYCWLVNPFILNTCTVEQSLHGHKKTPKGGGYPALNLENLARPLHARGFLLIAYTGVWGGILSEKKNPQ